MPDTIDSLQIKINAEATKANDAIDKLVVKLDRLTTSLSKINGTNLNGLANGVQRLGTAMQTMNNIKTADFTRLATNLTRLGSVNTSALNNAASSMSHLTRAFNGLGTASANAQSISQLVNSISRLGGASVQRAITNIPQLAIAMSSLMATLSRAPIVNQNIIQMTNALANLASQGSKVGTASNSIVAGFNKTEKATRKSSKGFKGLASAIGKFYATYFMAIRGLKGLWSSIESTADYIEAYNYFNVSLGKIGADWAHQFEKYGYDNAESYAESFGKRLTESLGKLSGVQISVGANGKGLLTETGMKNLGLNIQEITQYASQLASVTNSVGQTGETSLAISSSFTKLAGDISSLFNVDYSSVSKNLQSGLIGQSRALYKYGIDITNATLQTKAYELGLSKTVSEMTQAEKMQLRMLVILKDSKVAWGDLANTINSPSNMIRQFKNNLKETGLVLGQLFIPTLQKVLPLINGASIAFKRLLTDIAGFLNINIDLDSFGQGYTDMEDDVNGITDSYEDATKAAEEWKNQVLGFDEVNKMTENASADNTGLEDSTIDLTDNIIAASSEYEKVWKKAYEQMENSANAVADKIEKAFEPLKNIGKLILKGDLYEAGSSLAELLNNGIIDYDWGKVGSWVGNRITATIDLVAGFTNNLDWKGLARNLTSFVNSAIKNINVSSLADAINGLLNGIWDFAVTLIKTFDFGQLVKTIGGILNNLDWGTVIQIMSSIIAVKWIGKAFSVGFSSIKSAISTGITNIFSAGLTGASLGIASALSIPLVAGIGMAIKQAQSEAEYWEKHRKWLVDISMPTAEWQAKINELAELTKGLVEESNRRISQLGDIDVEYKAIKNMSDRYFELADKQNKSNEELAEMQGLHDTLINKYPELKSILDDEKTSYTKQKEEVTKLISELERKARMKAAEELLTQAYKDQITAEENLKKATENYNDAYKDLNGVRDDYMAKKDAYEKQLERVRNGHLEEAGSLVTLKKEMDDALEKYSQTSANILGTRKEMKKAEQAYNDIGVEIKRYSDIYKGEISSTAKSVSNSASNFANAGKNLVSGLISGINDKGIISQLANSANYIKGLISSKFNNSSDYVTFGENILGGLKIGLSNNSIISSITSKVTGIANSIKNTFTGLLGIHSPSTVFEEYGEFTFEGYNIGAENMFSDTLAMFKKFGSNIGKYAVADIPDLTYNAPSINSTYDTNYVSQIDITNQEEIALLRQQNQLLQALLQKENAVISPDADGIFRIVQNKANIYTTQTGNPAFLI